MPNLYTINQTYLKTSIYNITSLNYKDYKKLI